MLSKAPEPLFIIRPPQGQTYVIWADGTTSGFPGGSVVVNRIGRARTGVVYAQCSLHQSARWLWALVSDRRQRGKRN